MKEDITKNKKYALYCEHQAKELFRSLTRLKIKKDNEETVDYFLKENKIKRKYYEIELEKLYSKCEFLMMRYSEDRDVIEAYKELNGDDQAGWFFSIAYKMFLNKKDYCFSKDVNQIIEEMYKIPTWTALWMRVSYW